MSRAPNRSTIARRLDLMPMSLQTLHDANMSGTEAEGRTRGSVNLTAGPARGSEHVKGLAWVVQVIPTYRLRPEGLFLECPNT